jgi:predicted membrane-bound mannosyltransferase/DNA-binding beta-propeller fold protein YncE/uncharacterized membrane protein
MAPAASAPAAQASSPAGWLDRPLAAVFPVRWETLIWIGIFLLGAATRFYMLDVRAMSHDESLHAIYSYYLYANGNYDHNPMMHGPFLFHANALMYFLFGDSDYTARLWPAIFGMGIIWMMYLLRTYIGRTGAIVAGVLVVISPSISFHSRYIRDDIYIAFDALVWAYGAFRYLDRRQLRYLVIMALGMAFGLVAMEAHFIYGAIFGAFFAGLALWQVTRTWMLAVAGPLLMGGAVWYLFHERGNDLYGMIGLAIAALVSLVLLIYGLRGRWQELRHNAAADLTVIMLTLVLPFLAPFIFVFTGGDPKVFMEATQYTSQDMILKLAVMVGACVVLALVLAYLWFGRRHDETEGAVRWRPRLTQWALLMGIFWAIQVVFFTTFFTNTVNGLATGVVGSLGYWLAQQGVRRGSQPVYYYALVGWLYEFLPAILSIGGIVTLIYNGVRSALLKVGWDPVVSGDLPPARGEEAALRAENPDLLRDHRVAFVIFGAWWAVTSWIAYTVAGEKMPWLFTHIALPMCILGAWWFGYLLRHIRWRAAWAQRSWLLVFAPAAVAVLLLTVWVATTSAGDAGSGPGRVLQWLLILAGMGVVLFLSVYWIVRGGFGQGMRLLLVGGAAVLLAFTVRTSYILNFINYDMATEYLVYAHAGPDVKRALAELDSISQRTVGDRNIAVAYDSDSSWPLTWYMRQYPNSIFYGTNPSTNAMQAPVIIVGPENRAKVEPYAARDYVKRTYRLVWWPEMDYFNLTPDRLWGAIADPAQRQRIFDIVAFRKYRDPENLSQYRDTAKWPYQHEFDMYVRRDLAPLIWDLNVLPILTEAPNVPVIAPEQMRTVPATQVYSAEYAGLPLQGPRAVAIGPAGERVIADAGNHRIVVLDNAGNFLNAFGSHCNVNDPANTPCIDPDGDGPLELGDGQFYEPWGVAVDTAGNIYVADTWNGRIQVFDRAGNFLRKWGLFATTNGEAGDPLALFGPRGLAVDLDGNLLVADTGNKRILKFSPTGEFIQQIGGGGVVPGRFEEPTDVTVDPTNGNVLVADSWNGRVQRFGANLEFLREFPVPGWAGRDVYQKPFLAVTADGAIYATDPATAQVIVFAPDGTVRAAFGGPGFELERLGLPNGIAADLAGGTVVVADGGNNRVAVFPQVE